MSYIDLYPNFDFSVQCLSHSGIHNYLNVNTSDSDTYNKVSGMYEANTKKDLFYFTKRTTEAGPISSVKICSTGACTVSGTTYQAKILIGATEYSGTLLSDPVGSFNTNDEWTTNPATGVAWTWADINNLIAGYEMHVDLTKTIQCSYTYVRVTYTNTGFISSLTLRPNSDHLISSYSYPSTAHYENVDEETLDTSSYNYMGGTYGSYGYDIFDLPNHTTQGSPIDSVTVHVVSAGSYGSAGICAAVEKDTTAGHVTYYNANQFPMSSGMIGTFSQSFGTNPFTGTSWTWDDIDVLRAGYLLYRGTGTSGYSVCHQHWVTVEEFIGQIPVMGEISIYNFSGTAALIRSTLSEIGYSACSERGVCYGTVSNPTTANYKDYSLGTYGTDAIYFTNLTNVVPNKTWYVRAYAVNEVGVGYSSQGTFSNYLPVVATLAITDAKRNTALGSANVLESTGSFASSRGICYNTSGTPTVYDAHIDSGSGTGTFSVTLTGLNPGSTYYARAYANNSAGTGYGEEITFVAQDRTKTFFVVPLF